jgi:hypothetical protein
MINDLYSAEYERAESRVLYLLMKKEYKTYTVMAEYMRCTRQYVNLLVTQGVPPKYASYIGRKHGIHPGLFNYAEYCLMADPKEMLEYPELLRQESKNFDKKDREYILKGSYKNKADVLKENDKCIGT